MKKNKTEEWKKIRDKIVSDLNKINSEDEFKNYKFSWKNK